MSHDAHWRDECGVFGIFDHPKAAELTYYALFALQHRGEESAGIATVDGISMFHQKGMGLVGEAIPAESIEQLSRGTSGIGHVRYSTAGQSGHSQLANAQPLVFRFQRGNMALAHNGNITNAEELRGRLERNGAIFQTSSDTEVVAHLIVRTGNSNLAASVAASLSELRGGYALCILTDDTLVAVRDPQGLRPMVLGQVDGQYCVASESCALDTIGATLVRDVEPGELLVIDRDGLRSVQYAPKARRALCSFEHIYFARPDSEMDGHGVHEVRKRFGGMLQHEQPTAGADVVIGVPDSSTAAAMGYAEAAQLPYDIGLIKSHYIGRTFIQPSQELREKRVHLKLNPVRHVVAGKSVVMIDDSLVRGTTSMRIVRLLREAGAREVHVRIASPPVTHSCFYGIDTAHRSELIASNHSVEEIRELIGADSLAFLSEPGMMQAFNPAANDGADADAGNGHCNACFTGKYPVPTGDVTLDDSSASAGEDAGLASLGLTRFPSRKPQPVEPPVAGGAAK